MAETIEIGDSEFDAEQFLGAVEAAQDEEGYITGNGRCGDVAVFGDSDEDMWGTVGELDGDGYAVTYLGGAVDEAEAALDTKEVLAFVDDDGDAVCLDVEADYEVVTRENTLFGPVGVCYMEDDIHDSSDFNGYDDEAMSELSEGDWERFRIFESIERREL